MASMEMIIIGINHCFDCDEGLEERITKFAETEKVVLIGEERPSVESSRSAARNVAESRGIPWVQIDMNIEQPRVRSESARDRPA